jgi:hypothetical protein
LVQKRLSIFFALATVLLVLNVSGCGGGDSAETSLTKKQFVKRAKSICVAAENEQFNDGIAYMEKHPGIEEEEAIVPAGLPPLEKELEKLKALGAPRGDEAKIEEFLEELEKAITETKDDPGTALVRKGNPFNKANELAKSYGLEGCYGNP